MNIPEKKPVPLNNIDSKMQKELQKKKAITPKKKNLCKKYFYIDTSHTSNLNNFNNGKILQLIENYNKPEKGGVLEQVDYIMTEFERKKEELNQKKIDCIKSMILHNKKIPERWIMKSNYKDLLNQAMEDDIVLNYAIECKDIHKKSAGLDQSDETRYQNFKKSLLPEKKFISYINPYAKNYFDSPIKKQLMNDYCLNLRKKNNDFKRNRYANNHSLNDRGKHKRCNSIENIPSINKLPPIKIRDKNDIEQNNEGNKDNKDNKEELNIAHNINNETKDDLMMTSLYYSGYNDNNNNPKKELKLPELPLI
jgi:hypothetical protein